MDKDNIAIMIEEDNQFLVWNHKKELEDNCHYFEEHDDFITKLLVINRKYIYSASNDATIKRWYPRGSGQTSEITYTGHTGPITDLI